MDWPTESIPDRSSVYRHVHRNHFDNGELTPGAFMFKHAPFSVDWDKYSTPEETRGRRGNPDEKGVIELAVGSIREIETLTVRHDPAPPDNRAHSLIIGKDLENDDGRFEEARLKLVRISTIVIDPSPPNN